jgi:hypothetical protein
MKFYFASLLLAISITGCATPLNYIQPYLPEKEQSNPNHLTVSSVLEHYFTPQAHQRLKEIPAVTHFGFSAYAAGVNIWADIASLVTLAGVGRKVIIPMHTLNSWGVSSIIHEYIHHFDDLDRDGEEDWIDPGEFKQAYLMMARDHKYAGIAMWVEGQTAKDSLPSFMGIGELSEHIAYVAQHLALKDGPDYMKYVYRKILNVTWRENFDYVTINGVRYEMRLDKE